MTHLEYIDRTIGRIKEKTCRLSREIWGYAEPAYGEVRSSAALAAALQKEGFALEMGIAGIPTAFSAAFSQGTGRPVVGILGEYDALPGLSQEAALPEKKPLDPDGWGHGCGHNLLGAGSFAAAVAIKDYLAQTGADGAVVYFGCPGEEAEGSKQFMARAGSFDKVDFVYTWHPATLTEVTGKTDIAMMGARFIFRGIAAHAGGSPHLGRSALDAAELMNIGCNYLREHMPDSARIHYAYENAGGSAPNVVPDYAAIKYEVRAPKVNQMKALFSRVVKVAQGAALMTETTMDYAITYAYSDYRANSVLAQVASQCMQEVGAPPWVESDYCLAAQFQGTHQGAALDAIREELTQRYGAAQVRSLLARPLDAGVHPYDPREQGSSGGSTDVGDVSYAAPTVNIDVATACVGNPGHSWQNTALACSPIGEKGMLTAARIMALASLRLMECPELLKEAKKELLERNGGRYQSPLPEGVLPPTRGNL